MTSANASTEQARPAQTRPEWVSPELVNRRFIVRSPLFRPFRMMLSISWNELMELYIGRHFCLEMQGDRFLLEVILRDPQILCLSGASRYARRDRSYA